MTDKIAKSRNKPKKYKRGVNCGRRGPLPGSGGQPCKLNNEILLGQIQAYASLGLTVLNICRLVGIDESTFYRNYGKNKKLVQVFETGRAKGVQEAALALKDLIEAKDFNAIKFFLTHIAKWCETPQKVELTGKDGGPIEARRGLTPEEADLLRRNFLGVTDKSEGGSNS